MSIIIDSGGAGLKPVKFLQWGKIELGPTASSKPSLSNLVVLSQGTYDLVNINYYLSH